jgi:hypothetical protein
MVAYSVCKPSALMRLVLFDVGEVDVEVDREVGTNRFAREISPSTMRACAADCTGRVDRERDRE